MNVQWLGATIRVLVGVVKNIKSVVGNGWVWMKHLKNIYESGELEGAGE